MFEEHTLAADDLEPLRQSAHFWKKTYYRIHKKSLRPLKIWFAEGKRKSSNNDHQPTRFVYIEYQDNRGNNRFSCLEVAIAGQSVNQILADAVSMPMPMI